jgi:hypothetical protein
MTDYWGNLSVPLPLGYITEDGRPDWQSFRRDLRDQFLGEHVGQENAVTTRGLAELLFGSANARAVQKMGQELDNLRAALEVESRELVNLDNTWWVASRPEDHLRYANKGVRQIKTRLERTGRRLEIGATEHPRELGGHPALGMIAGARVAVGELESSLDADGERTDGGED